MATVASRLRIPVPGNNPFYRPAADAPRSRSKPVRSCRVSPPPSSPPEGGDFNDDLAALGPQALAARLAPFLGPGP